MYAEFGFIAVMALLCAVGTRESLFASAFAVVLHESAHLTVMYLMKIKVQRIIFQGCGIKICPETRLISYGKELLVLLSGAAANITAALLLWLCGEAQLAQVQFVLGAVNLLPCSKLDGGAALRCIIAMNTSDSRAEVLSRIISVSAPICAIATGLAMGVENFTYYSLFIYLAVSELLF